MPISSLKTNNMRRETIELELRAEIHPQNYHNFKKRIESLATLHSHTKRLSVMLFGKTKNRKIDIRVRTTNGVCEIVIKTGSFGSHDRIEISQGINKEQFVGMVKIFSQLGFAAEVGERETFNYSLPNNITISLVSAGDISYIEIEKMSSRADLDKNKKQLEEISDRLSLKLLQNEKEFNELCKRLSRRIDWPFLGTKKDYLKLSKLFGRYTLQKKRLKKKRPSQ